MIRRSSQQSSFLKIRLLTTRVHKQLRLSITANVTQEREDFIKLYNTYHNSYEIWLFYQNTSIYFTIMDTENTGQHIGQESE